MNANQIAWQRMADRVGVLLRATQALHEALLAEGNHPDSPYGEPGGLVFHAECSVGDAVRYLRDAQGLALDRIVTYADAEVQ